MVKNDMAGDDAQRPLQSVRGEVKIKLCQRKKFICSIVTLVDRISVNFLCSFEVFQKRLCTITYLTLTMMELVTEMLYVRIGQ